MTDELVTKADLHNAVKQMDMNMHRALAEMEARLAWKIIGAMVGLTAIFGIMLAVMQMWAGG